MCIRDSDIYFELMKERVMPFEFAFVAIVIAALQLIGYMHYNELDVDFKDNVFTRVSDIVSIFRIYPLLESDNATVYWALQFVFFALIILYILQLIYVHYSIRAKKFFVRFPLSTLRNMSSVFYWVLTGPMVEMFVSTLRCKEGYHVIDTSLKCWTGVHIFYCIFFLLGLVLFTLVCLLISILYNESRSISTDALARLDGSLEPYFFLYRVLVGIMAVFISSTSANWILFILYVLGSFYLLLMYILKVPYYNKNVSITYGICMAAYFWTSLIFLLLKALGSDSYYWMTTVSYTHLTLPTICSV
eukprot:TRINITY_DN20852_c0_g1_i1.p1 TRINITY_DN20852_c0_g1~~TRINITY_DN20852_c0_g1_i1.p1  ORF type:complete len:303 (-),score=41.42 TRINITY_DN20852_c0_g1_i1:34-942(-)